MCTLQKPIFHTSQHIALGLLLTYFSIYGTCVWEAQQMEIAHNWNNAKGIIPKDELYISHYFILMFYCWAKKERLIGISLLSALLSVIFSTSLIISLSNN